MTSSDAQMRVGGGAKHERDLLRAVARGNVAAFDLLYRRYVPRLRAFLYRLVGRPGLTEELLDETMLVVWRRAHRYDGSALPSTWIFAIAQRKALHALRRARTAPDEPAPLVPPAPDSVAQHSEWQGLVARALTQLPEEQNVVVRLAYFEGYSCREIAKIMECPIDTVKTRAFLARRKLKVLLAEAREAEQRMAGS